MPLLPGKQIADEAIDSRHYIDGSIDGEHLSASAKTAVLDSKNIPILQKASDIAAGSGSTLTSADLIKKIIDASSSKKLGGTDVLPGIVKAGSNNFLNITSASSNDTLEDGFQRQIYARLTSTESAAAQTYTATATTAWTASATITDVVAGDFIAIDSDGQYFEVASASGTALVIVDPGGGIVLPTTSGSEAASFLDASATGLVASFYVDITGTETAHVMGSETVDMRFREAKSFADMSFGDLAKDPFGVGAEINPSDSYEDVGSGNPNTTSGADRIGTDASAISPFAGSTDTVQGVLEAYGTAFDGFDDAGSGAVNITSGAFGIGTDASELANGGTTDNVQQVLEAFDSAITAAASSGDTPNQESLASQVITGTDTALVATLSATPVSNASVSFYLNGVLQEQGATKDYTVSGSTITILASSGTSVDYEVADVINVTFLS